MRNAIPLNERRIASNATHTGQKGPLVYPKRVTPLPPPDRQADSCRLSCDIPFVVTHNSLLSLCLLCFCRSPCPFFLFLLFSNKTNRVHASAPHHTVVICLKVPVADEYDDEGGVTDARASSKIMQVVNPTHGALLLLIREV